MIELDVYAAGLRDFNKILELDHQLEAIAGLRDKFGNNHDLAISSSINLRSASGEICAIFFKLGLNPRFIRIISAQLRPKPKKVLLIGYVNATLSVVRF